MSDITSTTATASDLQMDFMNLLVTQLKNQNPMEPMDSQDMSAQLAQFSELEQLEAMNNSFSQVLESVEREYAGSLIGKDISFNVKAVDGSLDNASGAVEEVVLNQDGEIGLVIGEQNISLADVLSVRQ